MSSLTGNKKVFIFAVLAAGFAIASVAAVPLAAFAQGPPAPGGNVTAPGGNVTSPIPPTP